MSENDDYLRPWASDMLRVGAVDNRGNPSGRALAKMAGSSNATITRMLQGITEPQPATVQKVADALEINAAEVWRRLGAQHDHVEAYEPPAESSLLTPRERRLVTEMIRVLVEGRHERITTDKDRDTADTPVAGRPVADGSTRHLSALPRKLSWAEREELYAKAREVDLDAEPYAAADPEDPGEGHDPV